MRLKVSYRFFYRAFSILPRPMCNSHTERRATVRSMSVGSGGCLHDGIRRWYVSVNFPFPCNRVRSGRRATRLGLSESRSNKPAVLSHPLFSFLTTENVTEERTEATTPAQPIANVVSETTHVSENTVTQKCHATTLVRRRPRYFCVILRAQIGSAE